MAGFVGATSISCSFAPGITWKAAHSTRKKGPVPASRSDGTGTAATEREPGLVRRSAVRTGDHPGWQVGRLLVEHCRRPGLELRIRTVHLYLTGPPLLATVEPL